MLGSFYIGAIGMSAQQTRLDTIANNVANVSTPGFKKSRVTFEDLAYRRLDAHRLAAVDTAYAQVGLGAAVAQTAPVFAGGDPQQTNRDLDLAIKGAGFFEVQAGGGEAVYTRLGALRVNADGDLTTPDGDRLSTRIRIPADATKLTVSAGGEVAASVPTQEDPLVLGDLELANFVNPEGLRPLGQGLYAKTELSGEPYTALPGQNGIGTLTQGFLESSNVDLTGEMVDLVIAQRAYQLNSKVLQISDDILASIASMRR